MGKSSSSVPQHKQKRGGTPEGRSFPQARSLGEVRKQLIQWEAFWESFPQSLIACDRHQKILRINAAARTLFEVASEAHCQGRDYQQFLTSYLRSEEQSAFVSSGQWLRNFMHAGKAGAASPEQRLLLNLPSGRKVPVMVGSFPVRDQSSDTQETISVFQELTAYDQEVAHFQRVQESMLSLLTAVAQMPEMEHILPEETFLLSPPVLFVAQQVVDVIRSVLDGLRVSMLAFGSQTGHLYFVAGSGYSAEYEQYWRDIAGHFYLSALLDDAAYTRLEANQEVVRTIEQLHVTEHLGKQLPPPAPLRSVFSSSEIFLFLPLFLEQQWVGVLVLIKVCAEEAYTSEEITLAKTVTGQTMQLIERIHGFSTREGEKNPARVQREVHRLAGDFLILASHELRTPLTGIQGNLQLARNRLQAFQEQFTPLAVQIREPLARVERPLVSASQSAQLQQRLINDVIDDARIQTNTLSLSLKPEDLGILLREVIVRQYQSALEPPIVLDFAPVEQPMPILADAGRITYVLTTYLTNARTASPPGRPVKVHVWVEETLAHVSVHNEGAGIAREDLDHVWERFYRAKGSEVQHGLDLSGGLPLYLCRVFMERHHGSVGVQSVPGQGATFWLTVPITPSLGK